MKTRWPLTLLVSTLNCDHLYLSSMLNMGERPGAHLPGLAGDESESASENSVCDEESSSSSGGSDASDPFHLRVDPDKGFETEQDSERRKASRVATLLRDKPLLPCMPDRLELLADTLFLAVDTGMKLPVAHCAFRGCSWIGKHSDDIADHVMQVHAGAIREIVRDVDESKDYYLLTEISEYMCRVVSNRGGGATS